MLENTRQRSFSCQVLIYKFQYIWFFSVIIIIWFHWIDQSLLNIRLKSGQIWRVLALFFNSSSVIFVIFTIQKKLKIIVISTNFSSSNKDFIPKINSRLSYLPISLIICTHYPFYSIFKSPYCVLNIIYENWKNH